MTARDPQWLYAHWDMSDEQVRHYNALSFEGHLSVRVHSEPGGRPPVVEAHVLPESRHWFIYVGPGAASYVAQLGYYDQQRQWRPLAASPPVQTPEPFPALAGPELFATLPLDIPLAEVAPLVEPQSWGATGGPQTQAPGAVAGDVRAEARTAVRLTRLALTLEQRRALSQALQRAEAQSEAMSSAEFLLPEVFQTAASERSNPTPGADLAEQPSPLWLRDRPAPGR